MDDVCNLFPIEFASICDYFVNTYGDVIVQFLNEDMNVRKRHFRDRYLER